MEIDLAVNVSARDLADARFPDEVARALADHRVEPSWLELEVTESVLLSDRLRTSRMLERLVEQGVRIAIDDFGVGLLVTRPAAGRCRREFSRSTARSCRAWSPIRATRRSCPRRSSSRIVWGSRSSRRASRHRPIWRVFVLRAATSARAISSAARSRAIRSCPPPMRCAAPGCRTRARTSFRFDAPAEATSSGTLGGAGGRLAPSCGPPTAGARRRASRGGEPESARPGRRASHRGSTAVGSSRWMRSESTCSCASRAASSSEATSA